jgi:hypothetical protein
MVVMTEVAPHAASIRMGKQRHESSCLEGCMWTEGGDGGWFSSKKPNLYDLYVLLQNLALFALIFGLLYAYHLVIPIKMLKWLCLIFFIGTLCRQFIYLNSVPLIHPLSWQKRSPTFPLISPLVQPLPHQ